jgi:hypothetical protein
MTRGGDLRRTHSILQYDDAAAGGPEAERMNSTNARLTSWSLVIGSVVATTGYASAFAANGSGDERFAGSSWVALYTVALLGNVLVLLGLPALVHAQADRFPVLTRIGYVGVFVPLVILNIGEGTVEGFVKPYLAAHGGIPEDDLAGLTAYEIPALLVLLVGMVCLGIAVLRARVLPRWVGVLFLVVPFLGAAGLQGAVSLAPDYLLYLGLFTVGVLQLRELAAPRAVPAAA